MSWGLFLGCRPSQSLDYVTCSVCPCGGIGSTSHTYWSHGTPAGNLGDWCSVKSTFGNDAGALRVRPSSLVGHRLCDPEQVASPLSVSPPLRMCCTVLSTKVEGAVLAIPWAPGLCLGQREPRHFAGIAKQEVLSRSQASSLGWGTWGGKGMWPEVKQGQLRNSRACVTAL